MSITIESKDLVNIDCLDESLKVTADNLDVCSSMLVREHKSTIIFLHQWLLQEREHAHSNIEMTPNNLHDNLLLLAIAINCLSRHRVGYCGIHIDKNFTRRELVLVKHIVSLSSDLCRFVIGRDSYTRCPFNIANETRRAMREIKRMYTCGPGYCYRSEVIEKDEDIIDRLSQEISYDDVHSLMLKQDYKYIITFLRCWFDQEYYDKDHPRTYSTYEMIVDFDNFILLANLINHKDASITNRFDQFIEQQPSTHRERILGETILNISKHIDPICDKTSFYDPPMTTIELERIRATINNKDNHQAQKSSLRSNIPKRIKTMVWDQYVGADVVNTKCFCCNVSVIRIIDFACGHIQSVACGGKDTIENLRPICHACNSSMGTSNMIEFMIKYGLNPTSPLINQTIT